MTAKIVVGLTTYLEDFANGQVGLRTPPYTQYATDHDTNYKTIRTAINSLINEVNAVQGPNASLGLDLSQYDDPARAGGLQNTGLYGIGSYKTTIGSPTSELDVTAGAMLLAGTRVSRGVLTVLAGSGGAGTRWVAVDVNGLPTLQTSANALNPSGGRDIYSATWDGAAFTAVTRIAEVFFDGDDQESLRKRVAVGTSPISFAAVTYESVTQRVTAIERMIAGFATDVQGNALGQPALRLGTAGAPGLVFEGDPNTGIYSPAADQLAISTGGTNRLAITTTAITLALQALFSAGSAANPAITFTSDPDTGIYSSGANLISISTTGVQRVEFGSTSTFFALAPANPVVFRGTENAVGSHQIRLEGARSGYGAGMSFQSELSDSPFTLTEMARITADGEAAWNTTPATQSAGLNFYTRSAGTTAKRAQLTNTGTFLLGDGSPTAPTFSFLADASIGFFRQSSTLFGLTTGGTTRMYFGSTGIRLAVDGSASIASITWDTDENTGIYRAGADRLAFTTAGVQCGEFDATGNLDLPTNSRVKGRRTSAQTIADNTATFVDFNAADDFDIGTWHDHTSGTLGVRESFTVPTGADGLYMIVADFEWAPPTPLTTFLIEITVNGTADSSIVENEITGQNFSGQLTVIRTLAAADVVKMRVTQVDTVGAASLDLQHATLSIVKMA